MNVDDSRASAKSTLAESKSTRLRGAKTLAQRYLCRQMNIATEGVRHQTTCLGLLQQSLCLVGVATRSDAQLRVRQELREAHLPIGPLNSPFGANIETNPAELEPNGNGAKGQDETIGHRCCQKALRRPLIARTIELLGHG